MSRLLALDICADRRSGLSLLTFSLMEVAIDKLETAEAPELR